jgi:hypothetical protein
MSRKNPQDLESLSDLELLILEDKLLLENELLPSDRPWPAVGAFFTVSRLVIYFLATLLFSVSLLLLTPVFTVLGLQNNPLAIFLYVGCLVGCTFVAIAIWERIGLYPRYFVRTALHYWPVTFSILVYILVGWRSFS